MRFWEKLQRFGGKIVQFLQNWESLPYKLGFRSLSGLIDTVCHIFNNECLTFACLLFCFDKACACSSLWHTIFVLISTYVPISAHPGLL